MINWTYNQNDFKINENKNTLIPEGDHRVVVNRVTIKTYSSGNEGFEIMLDVSGYPGNLGKFFESFGITNYDLNDYESWAGKDGAVRVKHDSYNGSMNAKVLFCITRAYQAKLPAWGQASRPKPDSQTVSTKVIETLSSTRSINNVPDMPNEHVSEVYSRQRKFDGFLL